MSVFHTLRELTTQLSLARGSADIGQALFCVSKRFGFATALVVDMTKVLDLADPGIIFSAADRASLVEMDVKTPFVRHPLALRAQASERPFVMSKLRAEIGMSPDEWWASLPPYLKFMDGMVVPVHDQGAFAWYAGFCGREPDLSQRTMSVMSAAVHAGYARFRELANEGVVRSVLTPREAECLRWVADGKTDIEIGGILKISPRTVRFHINNAKMKLGVSTRIQAVAKRISGAA